MQLRRIVVVLLVSVTLLLGGTQTGTAQDGRQVRAIIVGINEYAPPHRLPFSINNVDAVEGMIRDLGWTDVTTFRDREADHDSVVKAIRQTFSRCGSEDIFFFYFSGHGGQKLDTNRDEQDYLDEYLCLVNSKGEIEQFIDDEIDEVMSECPAGMAALVIESCYAGGAPKGPLWPQTFSQEENTPLKQDVREGDDATAAFFDSDIPSNPREVVLTASNAGESSWQTPMFSKSVFTHFFVEAVTMQSLQANTNGDSYLSFPEIRDYTSRKCVEWCSKANITLQHPQLIPADDKLPDGGKFALLPDPKTKPDENELDRLVGNLEKLLEVNGKVDGSQYNLTAATDKAEYRRGEFVNMNISVDEKCYLYLINIYSDGKVKALFPNSEVPDNLVEAGIDLSVEKLTNGYAIRVMDTSEFGPEYYMVIASPIKLPLQDLLDQALAINTAMSSPQGVRGVAASIQMKFSNKLIDEKTVSQESGLVYKVSFRDAVSSRSLAMTVVKCKVVE